jgi:hypothetical protein
MNRPRNLQLTIERLQLAPDTPLPPGGIAALEAAIAEALTQALQAPEPGPGAAPRAAPATLAQAIARRLQPQLPWPGGPGAAP